MSLRFGLLRAQEVPKCQVCKTCFQLYCCLCRLITLQQLLFNSTRSAKTKNAAKPIFSIAAVCVIDKKCHIFKSARRDFSFIPVCECRSIQSIGYISTACCEPSPTTVLAPSSPCRQTSSSWSLTPSSGPSVILSATLLKQVSCCVFMLIIIVVVVISTMLIATTTRIIATTTRIIATIIIIIIISMVVMILIIIVKLILIIVITTLIMMIMILTISYVNNNHNINNNNNDNDSDSSNNNNSNTNKNNILSP